MTTNECHLSADALADLVRRLSVNRDEPVTAEAGWAQLPGQRHWLVHRLHELAPRPTPQLRVTAVGRPAELGPQLRAALDGAAVSEAVLAVALGLGAAAGWVAAGCRVAGAWEPAAALTLVGPGLVRVPLQDGRSQWIVTPTAVGPAPDAFLSRTAGALGPDAFARLRQLRAAIVGCGRLGSLAAEALAAVGVGGLALIDPDRLEEHNLGEMAGVGPADLGRPKAAALAQAVRRLPAATGTAVTAVAASVLTLPALAAIKPADVLVSCADSAAARLAAAVLAAVYLKPLLDVGTAILPEPDGRRMGADVRLVLPGRCLVCFGGLADLAQSREALLSGTTARRDGDFRTERMGSLRSLNSVAVGLGQTLLEQFLSGWLRDSLWLQVDIDTAGRPHLRHRVPPAPARCPLCQLTASGDAGLERLADGLSRL
jgi:molybdopterin/thiamine biosynthesis adenylyltransferase